MNTSATFVLVRGAWLGGWCWKKVIPRLRAAGHVVFAPTLTGLGERAHLLAPVIDLDTHIEDERQGLRFFELISAGRCPMITLPDELVKILLALV
jgi:hypothetical protein